MSSMVHRDGYINVRIKDQDRFKQVFPLNFENNKMPGVGRFILSILGKSIWVRKIRNNPGSFCYVSLDDDRYVIMPNWIEHFETGDMIPVDDCYGFNEPIGDGLYIEGVLVITD